jgi:hypothetical protein
MPNSGTPQMAGAGTPLPVGAAAAGGGGGGGGGGVTPATAVPTRPRIAPLPSADELLLRAETFGTHIALTQSTNAGKQAEEGASAYASRAAPADAAVLRPCRVPPAPSHATHQAD